MSNITLTIPNDDHIALRAFGKALEEIALAHGAEPRMTNVGELSYKLNIDTTEALERLRAATETLQQAAPQTMGEPKVDTTSQQVESLAAPMGDDKEQAPSTTDSTGTPWDERIHSASKALNADGTWRLRRKPKDMDEAEWTAFVEGIKACYEVDNSPVQQAEQPFTCEQQPINLDHVSIEPTREEVDELIEASNKMLEPPVTHQNPVYMYQESRNVYALGRSEEEIAEYETKGYVRHTQEQYDAWEGPNTADEGDDHHTDAGVVTEQTVAGIPPLPVPPPVALPGSTGATDLLPPPPVGTVVTQPTWDFPRLMTFLTERHGKIDVATVNTLLAQDGMLSVQELNAHPDKIGPFVARVKAHLGE